MMDNTVFEFGNMEVKVNLIEDFKEIASEVEHSLGLFVVDSKTGDINIYIQKELNAKTMEAVFWHEFAHAVLWYMGDDTGDEIKTSSLGSILQQTIPQVISTMYVEDTELTEDSSEGKH